MTDIYFGGQVLDQTDSLSKRLMSKDHNGLENIRHTIKFLNFRTQENFAVKNLKFKKRGQTFGYFVKTMQME